MEPVSYVKVNEIPFSIFQEKEKYRTGGQSQEASLNRSRHCLPGDEPSQPVAGVIGAAFSGVSIMVANILKLFKVRTR